MMTNDLQSDSVEFTTLHYRNGQPVTFRIRDGVIVEAREVSEVELSELPAGNVPVDEDGELLWAAPGLVDLQINGYSGYDFNTLPISEQMVGEITRALWREGITSYYPTVITNGSEAICEAAAAIRSAVDRDSDVRMGIGGIHLEGPFISPDDGPRGAHDRRYVKAPDWEQFKRWQEAAGGLIKIITVSPEWPDSAGFIAKCAENGVAVSIGHTAATPEQIREAVMAGATMSTHLGNGCHLTLPRHPNYLWEQLAQEGLWGCFIADGFHLPDQFLKVAFKVKGTQAMLVSDAVYLAGMPAGEYSTHVGGHVVLTPGGRLHLADNEKFLAGSAQMLLWGIEHVVRQGLATLADAWEMSSIRPAAYMKLPSANGLTPGSPADLVLFRKDGERIQVQQTYKNGKRVYNRVDSVV